jgi:hypothetical protein
MLTSLHLSVSGVQSTSWRMTALLWHDGRQQAFNHERTPVCVHRKHQPKHMPKAMTDLQTNNAHTRALQQH